MPSQRSMNIETLLEQEDKKTNEDPGHMEREATLKSQLMAEDPEEASTYEESKAKHKQGQSNPMRHLGTMRYFA